MSRSGLCCVCRKAAWSVGRTGRRAGGTRDESGDKRRLHETLCTGLYETEQVLVQNTYGNIRSFELRFACDASGLCTIGPTSCHWKRFINAI